MSHDRASREQTVGQAHESPSCVVSLAIGHTDILFASRAVDLEACAVR